MNYSTKKIKLKEVLTQLHDGIEGGEITAEKLECSDSDFDKILEMGDANGYINGLKIIKTKDKNIIRTDNLTLTEKGATYLKPNKPSIATNQTTNTFNFGDGDYSNSGFGSDFTVNNNLSNAVSDLKKYVSELPEEDRKIGNELVEVVEEQEIKKSKFSRFADFLENHPKAIELTGKAIVWSLLKTSELS